MAWMEGMEALLDRDASGLASLLMEQVENSHGN